MSSHGSPCSDQWSAPSLSSTCQIGERFPIIVGIPEHSLWGPDSYSYFFLLRVVVCIPHSDPTPLCPPSRDWGCFHPDPELRRESSLLPRPLTESLSLPSPHPWPQFRYKTRVYKQTNLDEKQLAKLHTKVRESCWHLPAPIALTTARNPFPNHFLCHLFPIAHHISQPFCSSARVPIWR